MSVEWWAWSYLWLLMHLRPMMSVSAKPLSGELMLLPSYPQASSWTRRCIERRLLEGGSVLYRFDVQYWTYEQACELPAGLPRLVLLADTGTLDRAVTREDDES